MICQGGEHRPEGAYGGDSREILPGQAADIVTFHETSVKRRMALGETRTPEIRFGLRPFEAGTVCAVEGLRVSAAGSMFHEASGEVR